MMYTLDNFYKSKQWEELRARMMLERLNEHGELICEHCGQPISKAHDCIGHHKTELTDELTERTDHMPLIAELTVG